ncbi:MAG: hypothetical protein IAF38_05905 [Bacteroidia bacterium]|nr:hypothetical protein [Bacteroidia bacterium]
MEQKKKFKGLLISSIVTSGVGIAFWIIGTLFKIMHWPGSAIALIFAAMLLVIALIILIVWAVLRVK